MKLWLVMLQAVLTLPLAQAEFSGELTKLKLDQPTEIDEIPCEKEALLFPDGRLESCLLARDTIVSGHKFPAGSWPYFDPPGTLKCVFLARDYEVQGYLLRGEGHNYQTCFHPNGWLRFGNLKEPTVIQGVPCRKSTFMVSMLKGASGVQFHANGRLKGCRLSEDIHSFKKDKWIEVDPEGNVVNVESADDVDKR